MSEKNQARSTKTKKLLLRIFFCGLVFYLALQTPFLRQIIIAEAYSFLEEESEIHPIKLNQKSYHRIEYYALFNELYCFNLYYFFILEKDIDSKTNFNLYWKIRERNNNFSSYYLRYDKRLFEKLINPKHLIPEYYKIRLKIYKSNTRGEKLVYDKTYSNYSLIMGNASIPGRQDQFFGELSKDREVHRIKTLCKNLSIGKYYFEIETIETSANNDPIFQIVDTYFSITPDLTWK